MANVKEDKDQPRKVSTCFDGSTSAELMEKLLAVEGIGSLSEEMMRSLAKRCCEGRREEQKNRESKTAQGRSQDPSKGEKT